MQTVCSELIDDIVEWIGQKWTKSQIKKKLRELKFTPRVMENLISLARLQIRSMYKIDPAEFKGSAIEFYCSVIRGQFDIRYKIMCQERLDKLLGIEHIASEDPNAYADRILSAMAEADGSVTGDMPEEQTVEENYSDIFGGVSVDGLEEHLKDLAVKLNAVE